MLTRSFITHRFALAASFALFVLFGLLDAQMLSAQKDTKKKSAESAKQETLATLRGRVVLNSSIVKEIDWSTLEGTVGQVVPLQQVKYPEDWPDMTQAQRVEWSQKFRESEEGKNLLAANQKKLEERFLEDFIIRDGGRFVVYDVPQGRFQINIVARSKVGDKTYVLRNFGEFEVGEVDEMKLGDMPLEVLRLLEMGEQAPDFRAATDDGQTMSLSQFRGKHLLLVFGLTSNARFGQTTAMLKDAAANSPAKDKFNVLTVTVDQDTKAVTKFNQDNGVTWKTMNLGKWDQKILGEYGLKMVPSIWLLDDEGKIVLTGSQFLFESNRTQLPIGKLVDEAISGRLKIGGEKSEGDTEKAEADK